MVPREEIAWHICKALIYMMDTNSRQTEPMGKPSVAAAAFDRSVKPRGRGERPVASGGCRISAFGRAACSS